MGTILDYEQIEELITVHEQAYGLLMWLADAVVWQPDLLVPEEAALLHKSEAVRQWLNKHTSKIPAHLLPARFDDGFINLFSSFFSTSFRIGHFEFDGKLVESSVKLGSNQSKTLISNPAQCEFLALKHLCNSENLYLTDKGAKAFIKHKSLKEALLIWTYIWELDRRAKGKGKGAVVHQIWRSIPIDTRKSLDVEKVWNCKEQILAAARDYIAEQQE
jgi:hypothetical protein